VVASPAIQTTGVNWCGPQRSSKFERATHVQVRTQRRVAFERPSEPLDKRRTRSGRLGPHGIPNNAPRFVRALTDADPKGVHGLLSYVTKLNGGAVVHSLREVGPSGLYLSLFLHDSSSQQQCVRGERALSMRSVCTR
jgi:hypothetical protein